jgi:hypothetical protein
MSLEYEVRAVGVMDAPDGSKVIVSRTVCGKTVKLFMHRGQADFVIKEINPEQEPCA